MGRVMAEHVRLDKTYPDAPMSLSFGGITFYRSISFWRIVAKELNEALAILDSRELEDDDQCSQNLSKTPGANHG